MTRFIELRRLDPIEMHDVERVTDRSSFEDLGRSIVGGARGNAGDDLPMTHLRPGSRARYRAGIGAVAAAVLLVLGIAVFAGRGGDLTQPFTTTQQSGRPFAVSSSPAAQKAGTWRLVDDLLTGTWQQNTSGPPPGDLDCPTASACYVMSGHYPNARADAPLLGEYLYVSDDIGRSWTVLSMPSGFAPTSPLSCGNPTTCAAGGTYNGQPVLVVTGDGGDNFTIDPLPSGVGKLYAVSCPTSQFCGGLVATSANDNNTPSDATYLSTSDGGSTFSDEPIANGDSMSKISCSSASACTVVGDADVYGTNDLRVAGVTATTTDGGSTWTQGSLPSRFAIFYISKLSCSDDLHCWVTGLLPSSDPSVRGLEGSVASTSDGGMTWSSDAMPGDVPHPEFSGLSCPTATECWVSGEEAVPAQVEGGSNASSVLLGTTDGGKSWSKVTFSVPNGAPDYDGQSYLSMGLISCPTAGVCAALGAGAQGSPTSPVYSFVVPASSPGGSNP